MNALSLVEKIACLTSEDKEWLERLLDRFLATPARKGCGCHVIDPKKQDMIIWRGSKDDLVVKISDQRFIALPRTDKRGQKYWKIREFYEDETEITHSVNPSASSLKEEIEVILKKPMSEQTKADREKWAKWTKMQAERERLEPSSEVSKGVTNAN
jgi:hypothetical protein